VHIKIIEFKGNFLDMADWWRRLCCSVDAAVACSAVFKWLPERRRLALDEMCREKKMYRQLIIRQFSIELVK